MPHVPQSVSSPVWLGFRSPQTASVAPIIKKNVTIRRRGCELDTCRIVNDLQEFHMRGGRAKGAWGGWLVQLDLSAATTPPLVTPALLRSTRVFDGCQIKETHLPTAIALKGERLYLVVYVAIKKSRGHVMHL